ncbi:phosphatase PAP2 family protein [Tundrisphaera lichenicola]|uniref:phosphatase PAP2 family protein n=1 Tax=Tundrisphaera lichenicola TaxID=2029860 RepID=UPI003EBE0D10
MHRWLSRVVEWLGGHELAVLLGSLAVVGGTWGFFALADLVVDGQTKAFDTRILLALRTPGDLARPIGPAWVEEMARDLTALGSTVNLWIATLAVVGFLALDRRYAAMSFVIGAVLSGWGLSFLLKSTFDRPRPDLVPHLMRAYFSSFPSGHSMMSAVVFGTLGSLLSSLVTQRRLKVYFLSIGALASILVGLTRVYLGVHYPTDVLAGWSAGLAWATLCWLIARKLQQRGEIEPSV